MPKPGTAILPESDRRRLAARVERDGERAVADWLGVTRVTIPRLLAGLPCRRATIAVAHLHLTSLITDNEAA